MLTARNIPGFVAVEPDRAREQVINMVRQRVQFCCEIDPRLRGMKDCVVLSRSAVLEANPGWTHLRTRCTHEDEAIHYALVLVNAEVTFQVNPEPTRDERMEWLFLVELRERKEAYG